MIWSGRLPGEQMTVMPIIDGPPPEHVSIAITNVLPYITRGAGRSDATANADSVSAGSNTFSWVFGLAPSTSFANSGAGRSVCSICCDCMDFHRDRLSSKCGHCSFFRFAHTGHTVPRSTMLKYKKSVIVDTFVSSIMRSLSASSGDDITNNER